MITLQHVHKSYHTRGVSKVVARDLNFEFPTMGAFGPQWRW
jgi:hypothetical protein